MKGLLVLAAAVFVGWLLPLTSDAQTIRLKNGNTLHGEVETISESQVMVDVPGVGKLTFRKDEIATIEESPQEMSPTEAFQTRPSRKPGNAARQDVKPNPYYAQARSLYQQGHYKQAEAKAQRALEHALRHGDDDTANRLRQIIRESRAIRSEQVESPEVTPSAQKAPVTADAQSSNPQENDLERLLDPKLPSEERRRLTPPIDQTIWNSVKSSAHMCESTCEAVWANQPEIKRERKGSIETVTSRHSSLTACKEQCMMSCIQNAPNTTMEKNGVKYTVVDYTQACIAK